MEHFSLSLLGYQRQQVNKKIDDLHNQLHQLTREVENLTNQNQQLSSELDHYKSMEEALQKGIVDARVTGNKIIDESSLKANQLMEQTKEQVLQYKEDFAFHSRELAQTGSHLKGQMNDMKAQIQEILDAYQEMVDKTDFDAIYPKKHIDRLLVQVDAYENEMDDQAALSHSYEEVSRNQPISEKEKVELEQLIQEVITNEANERDSDKLVDFSMIRNSQEG